ncbi:UNVERIFIED_CONTAM: hypothetical protein FKN15_022271 [Acipenser sinensis]
MHLKPNLLKAVTHLLVNTGKNQCDVYIKDLRRLQQDKFYTVYLGGTDISEGLVTGEFPEPSSSKVVNAWSMMHAGGSRGWVPWNYKLMFKTDLFLWNPSSEIFQELCVSLSNSYGKCVIVAKPVNAAMETNGSFMTATEQHHRPSSPVLVNFMSCCPLVAQSHGHEFFCLPSHCGHLSPLDTAWSALKWCTAKNRHEYTTKHFGKESLCKSILFKDLIETGMKQMTASKWETATSRVQKRENYYLNRKMTVVI